ncbi:HAD-IB family hydrolase [Pseudomaricurvus alkylphenolicus]|uniref:HAD-IB family hydrolase n=1 Tax=Pseudomaricurvus alkylphenolicus TaxID=1306991 RepID=UPI00141EEC4D|nr:HAD-IB family hydrolase [Pseudomaricurvus alkylphenolicus]NIB41671.1 HAD-IB family hydrolase [Pseudomaricurvus alkylphenolicus]
MNVHADVIKGIERQPDGPHIGAFFDFDGTVIAGFSVKVFLQEQLRRGDLGPREFAELMATFTNFSMGRLGFSGLMVASAQIMKGVPEQQYIDFGEELYEKHISRMIYPESRALIEAHLRKGHTVALISSATRYQVEAAAQDLGFDHILYTELEVEDGVFTGNVIRPTCYGEGKLTAAQKLAKEEGIDLDQSFFYTDSHEDLPLLEGVGHPQVLNPNSKLVTIAERRGWPIRRFGSRGRPKVTDYLRTAAATWSLVPSFAAGLPIRYLTGSKRESLNYSMALFGDTAAALIGMHVEARGEEHLWSQRPAVFIFNHQSQADAVIIAKLLRRDFASVGKKEIKDDNYIIGKIFEYGGTVLIDRKNAPSAIEAMQPLVDTLQNEGRSVVLSPEGTRTIGPKLAPFKKGAFHLAIQAGVPIVPIVIHNAGDVQPKGDWVFRSGTVEVDVLPPVDTSKWTVENIDQHVTDVRNMFLETLGQTEEETVDA